MEIPENMRELVDRLGQALVQALVNDPQCRELARQIQDRGFEVGLMIEATLALQRRGDQESFPEDDLESPILRMSAPDGLSRTEADRPQWSDDDRAFLQKFKISLD